MITLPKVKFEKVCGTSDERPALQNPYFRANKTMGKNGSIEDTPGRGSLMATNGFALAILPVTHEADDIGGPIPNDAIKIAQKAAKKDPATLDASLGAIEERTDCAFPRVEQIIPDGNQNTVSIALDAGKLYALADALCERTSIYTKPLHYIKLTIDTARHHAPILVEPTAPDSKGFGIIMPLHVGD